MRSSSSIHFKLPYPFPITQLSLSNRPRHLTIRAATSVSANFYDILGVSMSGTLGEIKQAYKQMARKYHPDMSPLGREEEYTERFIRVKEAYETLSDPKQRALYDEDVGRGVGIGFSTRRRSYGDQEVEDKDEWKNRWQSQVLELKRRSTYKNPQGNMSWGKKIRTQRKEV